MRFLVIVNDQPYGSERPYNALRLAGALGRRETVELRVFLLGDAVACAVAGQSLPEGHYHLDRMLNPDGVAAHTRQYAHGVDLNRNFPWRGRALQPGGGLESSGPHALSGPESRIAYSLVLRVRPESRSGFTSPSPWSTNRAAVCRSSAASPA